MEVGTKTLHADGNLRSFKNYSFVVPLLASAIVALFSPEGILTH